MARKIEFLVIHCTDTPKGRAVLPSDIFHWHTSPLPTGRGWRQVGYTDMILLDGTVARLVANNEDAYIDGWEITNGVAGINKVSRHIVYVGGKSGDTRTVQQKSALKEYVLDFVRKFPHVKVTGHYQHDPRKACPAFDVSKWCEEIGVPEKNIRR